MKTKQGAATAATNVSRARPSRIARFKRILVPVDFSECSFDALRYAEQFAAQHDSELIVLHVVEPIAYPTELGYPSLAALPPQNDYERASQTRLEHLQKQVARSGAKVTAKLRVGQPYFEIARAAQELRADMIIISTHGHTGLKHVFLGSTAERVVRHAECPVLTVRCRK